VIVLKDETKIPAYLTNDSYILDAAGAQYTSEEFAGFIKDRDITFIIGGPDGFSKDLKKSAKCISLSKMTFLHEMTQLIFLEQVYRAYMILGNRTYHK
jgi:23S rRNA (pseudouridine1915-N3)-methyltransferase